jgi:hypothetical protein
MTYWERQRLADIQTAIDAIRSHLRRGDLSDGLVFDVIRTQAASSSTVLTRMFLLQADRR